MLYIVIGLGNFGAALAEQLTVMGHEVIGVDSEMHRVEELKDTITSTICADLSDNTSLKLLPLKDADAVIVAIGENFGKSILATALLKQKGEIKRLIARATSALHRTVLETMGAEVISPENYAADITAMSMEFSGMKGAYLATDDTRLIEFELPAVLDKQKITEMNFESMFQLKLVGVKRPIPKKNLFGAMQTEYEMVDILPETLFAQGDRLLLFGTLKAFQQYWKQIK